MRLFNKKKETLEKTCWNDLTIGDMVRIKDIDSLQLATEDEKNLKIASIVCNIPYEEMIQKPLNEVRDYMDKTEFLLEKPVPRKARTTYYINGRRYTLLKNEMEMLTSQYIDLQAIYKDGFDKRPGELLSVMMVPYGHTYNDGYDKDQVIEDMYDMKVEEALGVIDFFTRRFVRLIAWTRTYYKWVMRWTRLFARKEEKEMLKATEIQMNLILDELNSMYGLIVQGL